MEINSKCKSNGKCVLPIFLYLLVRQHPDFMMHRALKALVTIALPLTALTGVNGQRISHSKREGRPTCTVFAGSSNATDDVPTILRAFKDCGHGGNVVFPEREEYHINSKLNPVVNDVNIEWRGEWVVSLINFTSNMVFSNTPATVQRGSDLLAK